METFKIFQIINENYHIVTQRLKISKCYWKNSANRLSGCRVATDPQFVKDTVSVNWDKWTTRKWGMIVRTQKGMFRMALFIVAKTENNQNVQLVSAKQMWYIHIMECFLAMKRNRLLIRAMTWLNLKNILLSEWGQLPKDLKICFHLHEMSRRGKSTETKNK